jgi:hypothetical protein
MEKFYTERSNGGLCDGFLCTDLQVNKKRLHIKFEVNQTYCDQVMLWTSLLSYKKINIGQLLKNQEVQSTSYCALHFFSINLSKSIAF